MVVPQPHKQIEVGASRCFISADIQWMDYLTE